MKTFTIELSEDQLTLIQAAVFFTEIDHAHGQAKEDLNTLHEMIEDLIKSDDTESTHSFCH